MKVPHLRWYVAALLFAATVINYIDRQTLSIVAPVLTRELNISPIVYSQILQAFLIAYTIMYVGSGFLVDRWGTRKSLAIFIGVAQNAGLKVAGKGRFILDHPHRSAMLDFTGKIPVGFPEGFHAGAEPQGIQGTQNKGSVAALRTARPAEQMGTCALGRLGERSVHNLH